MAKFYEKFIQNSKEGELKNRRREYNKRRDDFFAKQREVKGSKEVDFSKSKKDFPDAQIVSSENMFNLSGLDSDAQKALENYDQIVQEIRPLNTYQLKLLPKDIRELSHKLTDEREERRMGYMNATQELSAYVRYFTWWNLVRFTTIFSKLDSSAFNLKDGDVCLDIGSGPLTIPCALWLSRPELRNKRLTFYCMDISQSTLSFGEDIFMTIAAKVRPSEDDAPSHWNIVRVKGGIGTPVRKKANFISCANMFNELYQKNHENPEIIAENQTKLLMDYAAEDASLFIAEPGMPVAARFVSLIRSNLLKKDFSMVVPCPHDGKCPMNGLYARYGGSAKWCNFSFSTENAPAKLLKLSKTSGLPKDRAVISFVFASSKKQNSDKDLLSLRVASDSIWLPGNRQGFYCCSKKGLVLLVNLDGKKITCGERLNLKLTTDFSALQKDKKSSAIMIKI